MAKIEVTGVQVKKHLLHSTYQVLKLSDVSSHLLFGQIWDEHLIQLMKLWCGNIPLLFDHEELIFPIFQRGFSTLRNEQSSPPQEKGCRAEVDFRLFEKNRKVTWQQPQQLLSHLASRGGRLQAEKFQGTFQKDAFSMPSLCLSPSYPSPAPTWR